MYSNFGKGWFPCHPPSLGGELGYGKDEDAKPVRRRYRNRHGGQGPHNPEPEPDFAQSLDSIPEPSEADLNPMAGHTTRGLTKKTRKRVITSTPPSPKKESIDEPASNPQNAYNAGEVRSPNLSARDDYGNLPTVPYRTEPTVPHHAREVSAPRVETSKPASTHVDNSEILDDKSRVDTTTGVVHNQERDEDKETSGPPNL